MLNKNNNYQNFSWKIKMFNNLYTVETPNKSLNSIEDY